MLNWIRHWWDNAAGFVDNTIRNWVHDIINGLYSFLAIIFDAVGGAWYELEQFVDFYIREGEAFVRHVHRLFNDVIGWINKEGWTVFHYISHPSLLVDLIWNDVISKLEKEAWQVADKLGKFFLSLIVRNLKEFAILIEDILNAVF